MTRTEIINEITNDPNYLATCKRVCNGKDIYKDLYQYVVLYFLELDENRLIEIYNTGGIRNYIARVIYTQAYGKTSGFTREMKGAFLFEEMQPHHNSVITDGEISVVDEMINDYDLEIKKECARCETKGIYPTSVKLYNIYEEKGCYREVSRCLNIPYRTVQYHIHGLRNKLVKAVNDKNISSNTGANNGA